jgi:hypothetical protein
VTVVPSGGVGVAIEALMGNDVTRVAVLRPGSRTPDGVVSDIDLVGHLAR